MKNLLYTILLACSAFTAYAQPESYVVIGYGAEFNSFSKAYKNWNSAFNSQNAQPVTIMNSDGTTQTDYTPVEFDKDKFNTTNWVFKMGVLTEGFYFESDMSMLMQELFAVGYEWVADKDLKPTLHYGTAKLRKIDENTGIDSAYGLGSAGNLWNLDFGFGGNFMVGPYTGFSALSTHAFDNVGSIYATNQETYRLFDDGMVFGSLGIGFHMNIENQALVSLRVNRIRTRSKKGFFSNDEYEPWRGIEIYPSLKVWGGDEAGIYLEVFGKYYIFPEYENPEVIMPGFNFSTVGVSLGFYIPYY
ncbi:hypothetical protein [Parvicella tangerina]|uniref:Outer membrane protein beta-barrel domain-containing protein n=1 Tax=Parvicella tangerina TaxID=2829795 RepID=A0A916JK20_9FLAO|nr:hypothetical protein [Parvicella tangerina]CAG5078194.1 hypothetical protein CRYO30217_00601 [Parvicella tangerina]